MKLKMKHTKVELWIATTESLADCIIVAAPIEGIICLGHFIDASKVVKFMGINSGLKIKSAYLHPNTITSGF